MIYEHSCESIWTIAKHLSRGEIHGRTQREHADVHRGIEANGRRHSPNSHPRDNFALPGTHRLWSNRCNCGSPSGARSVPDHSSASANHAWRLADSADSTGPRPPVPLSCQNGRGTRATDGRSRHPVVPPDLGTDRQGPCAERPSKQPAAGSSPARRAPRFPSSDGISCQARADGDDQSMPSCLRRSATTVARTSNGWASAGGEGVTWASTAAITRQPICWLRSRFMCRYPFR